MVTIKDLDPQFYISLDEFDGENWEHFDASTWEENKDFYRKHLNDCWGSMPERVPMEPRLIFEEKADGYTRIKMEITVERAGIKQWDTMPFFILLPNEPLGKPCPTMIIHHQHAGKFDKGKEEPAGLMYDPAQAFAVDLVKRGYITACHDALCFSERREVSENYTFRKLLLFNRTLGLKYAWDVSRLLDYLETRDNIDSKRIGIMGHSLGGQEAIFCPAYDSRIKLAISSCGIAKLHGPNSILSEGITHNAALYLQGFLEGGRGMDSKEVVGLLHPRPVLLSHGIIDRIFPIEGVAELDNWVEEMYAHFGNSDKCVTVRHAGGHYIPDTTKELVYSFLEQYL
ncbi:MAG: alpha/beta hydrolase family protein [Candidatus Hodarchaeota archaeon]